MLGSWVTMLNIVNLIFQSDFDTEELFKFLNEDGLFQLDDVNSGSILDCEGSTQNGHRRVSRDHELDHKYSRSPINSDSGLSLDDPSSPLYNGMSSPGSCDDQRSMIPSPLGDGVEDVGFTDYNIDALDTSSGSCGVPLDAKDSGFLTSVATSTAEVNFTVNLGK